MSADVVKLTEHLLPDERNDELCEALRNLLDRAERGEIIALAWAGYSREDVVFNGWDGAGGTMFQTAAAIMTLHTRYSQMMMGDE